MEHMDTAIESCWNGMGKPVRKKIYAHHVMRNLIAEKKLKNDINRLRI